MAEKEAVRKLKPRRWKPAEIKIGKDTFMVHPDKKVYQKRGTTVRRVRDRELAKFVYGRWLKKQQDREKNFRLAEQRVAARLKAMEQASDTEPRDEADG